MYRKGDEPIPGYRLEKFLGKGQFGEVWRTTAPGGTSAALKFIDLGGKQGIKEFRGVQRVKEIRHANLMPITALWMLDGEGNILSDKAMESYDPDSPSTRATLMVSQTTLEHKPEWLVVAMLLGKKNLMDRLNECTAEGKQGIPPDELLNYMEEAAKGIDYLNSPQHDLGEGPVALQHCDIKPANIMLIGDAAVVCDFGLARVLSDAAATATGMVGSPAYMAPESIRRKPGQGSDQYSLAVSYVELRTGHLPFKELTYVEVLEANRQGRLELSRLDPAEQEVIRRATSLKPEDRYPSALAMVHALRRAIEGTPEGAPRFSTKLLAGSIAAVALVIPLAVVLALQFFPGSASYTLTFVPGQVTVVLNGAAFPVAADGTLTAELLPDQPVSIEASGPPDYLPLKKQFSLDELQQHGFRIELEHNAAYFQLRALDQLRKGDFNAAVTEYQQAVRLDPKYEQAVPVILQRHTKAVQGLAFSPDDKWLASAGDDGRVCLWPLGAGLEKPQPVELRGHAADKLIESLAISRDSRWLVTGSWDTLAIAWDLTADDPSASSVKLAGHEFDIVATAITPESPPRWIVTGSSDATVRLWPFSSGQPSTTPHILKGHTDGVDNILISADGRRLVTIDSAGNAFAWDLGAESPETTQQPIGKISHRRNVLRLSADARWLFTGDEDGKLHVYPVDGQGTGRTFPCASDALESLALDPSATQLFAGDTEGNVFRFQLTADGELKQPAKLEPGHAASCVAIAVSEDGKLCVTGGFDQTARMWELAPPGKSSPISLALVGKSGPLSAVAISSSGKWIACGTASGAILVWEVPLCRMILHATGGSLPVPARPVQTTLRPPRPAGRAARPA